MTPRQKVLLSQLQIASVGILIAGFGLVWKEKLLALFGALVFAYGLIRLFILLRFMKDEPAGDSGEEPLDLNAWLPDEDEKKQEEEDEWEKAIEAWMQRRHPSRFAPSSAAAVDESSDASDPSSGQQESACIPSLAEPAGPDAQSCKEGKRKDPPIGSSDSSSS